MNRAERFSYRDRRVKKRQFRKLWIQRIGAAARNAGMSYSTLMHGLKAAGVEIDREILSDIVKRRTLPDSMAAGRAGAVLSPTTAKAKKRKRNSRGDLLV